MNGVVFHTSALITAQRAGHASPVHRICACSSLLAIPLNAKMKKKSLAVTAVGMAHGTRTAARSSPRPLNLRCMISANHMPSTTSMDTEMTVNITVLPIDVQNSAPRLPCGQ